MRVASYDHFGISPPRIMGLGLLASSASYLALETSSAAALGEAAGPAALVVAALVFYMVVSTPRRILDRQRLSEAREAVALAASAMACLSVTGSRSKTLLTLHPRDQSSALAIRECAREILLGFPIGRATAESAKALVSNSAADALKGIASMKPEDFGSGDEESRGIEISTDMYRETKLPMFMTACFFSPIMLVLYSVFTHTYDPVKLVELVAFEFVIVDLAFFFSSVGRGPA